jgi:hypothetical protein
MVRSISLVNEVAILNICYEKENVKHVIKSGCIETVLSYIKDSKDGKLLAACAGAIQSVVRNYIPFTIVFSKRRKTMCKAAKRRHADDWIAIELGNYCSE